MPLQFRLSIQTLVLCQTFWCLCLAIMMILMWCNKTNYWLKVFIEPQSLNLVICTSIPLTTDIVTGYSCHALSWTMEALFNWKFILMHFITNCHATLVFYNDIHNIWVYAIKPCKVKYKDNAVPAWHFT